MSEKTDKPTGIDLGIERGRAVSRPRRADPEGDLQRRIVGLLRLAGVNFCHVPNSTGRAGARRQGQLAALGVTPGVSDLLIFDPPPVTFERPFLLPFVGAALEIKARDRYRTRGVEPWDDKRASVEQREFLRTLHDRNWAVGVCGPSEAEEWLRSWGYKLPTAPILLGGDDV